jgi:uncharacterized delta-60 repeat protein
VVGIWSRMRKVGESRGGSQTDRAPALEQLEPRLLLNGDLSGSGSSLLFPAPIDNAALVVDLDQQDHPVQEAATPLVSFNATDSETVADGSGQIEEAVALASDSGVTSQPVEVDSGSAGLLVGTSLLGAESWSQVQVQPPGSETLGQSDSAGRTATGQPGDTPVSESVPIEARGPPAADVYRHTTAVGNYAGPESSDPTKSPVTHTQAFGGVDVQPSTATAPAAPGVPVLGQPASYDLRTYGHVTPVKNQGNIGSCWAFGTYGSLESSILVDGGPATDLSENHLKNYHGFDWGPTAGGNYYMSEAYLSRWDGPVSEADDPYHDSDDRPSPGGPPQYYVREVLEFNSDSELKDGLMTYGAIGTVMYMNTTYYNATAHTYYYSGTANANHGVTIVGWDDNKAVPGAPGAGAWLIKNSWGTAWGDGGYFWLSYYDSRGANDGFAFTDAVAPTTFEKVYYYDYFGNIGGWNISYGFNAYTASSEQDLTAVQFWTMADGASYDIQIYDTFSAGHLSGLFGSASGTSTFAGLHTVNLWVPIHLTAGNDFYIYLHITDGGTYPLASDWAVAGYNSSCTASPGQSYYSSDGYNWKDLRTLDPTANFSIRGLVTTTTPPEITVLGNGVSINDGDMRPSSADGTDFGTVPLGTPISRTFTVRNDGTGNLVLGPVTVPTGFTVTEGLSSSLTPGASDTFTVRLDAAVEGTKSGHIVIQNDDRDEHPFNFAITGTVVGPEIVVLGNGISIVDGDTTPSASDGTHFGFIGQGGAAISHTFTVRNDGLVALTLGAVTVPTGYTLTEGLSASLAPGASDTFTVRLDTATAGVKTGDVSFSNNDSDENPFNFRIAGSVLGPSQPGDLDLTFGIGGIVTSSFGPNSCQGRAVALQPDGRIVVAGFSSNGSNNDFALVRYNVDGSLDTSFDGDGRVTTDFSPYDDWGCSVALRSDGKIVVAGYAGGEFAVARYNPNGSLDTSFGVGGKVTTVVGSASSEGCSVALQSDGKIVVVGECWNGSNRDFAVVRYNTNGSLDTAFGTGGMVTTAIGVSNDYAYSVALQADGKIVVAGHSYNGANDDFALVRYNADGSLDASFGVGGKVTTAFGSAGDFGYSVALQSDGKIVVAGRGGSSFDFALARYNANGSLDTSFDGDGKVTTNLGADDRGYSVAFQSDGKIVVAGASAPDLALVRYNVSGSLDTSFGGDGKVTANLGFDDTAYGAVIQSDGKIVVAGESANNFAVARFLGGAGAAEITVLGNGVSIADGDTTPSAADGTNFGSIPAGGAAVSRVFTVRNDGGSDLTLGAVTVPTGFTLTEGLSTNLAPGASDTFTVQLDATVAGPKEGDISFSTNDPDENPFNFRVAGTVANLALGRPVTASTSYSGLPASNATDGDLSSRWSSQFSDNEWIYVDLGSVYTIDQVVLRWESAYGRGYKIQVSSDAGSWSDVYTTTAGDGGVDDIMPSSPPSGRYVRMLGTQRATAYGYSLYELEVYGGAAGPEVTVLGNGISIADGDTTPSTADGTDFGSATQSGAEVSRVFTVRNDGVALLALGAVTVPAGFRVTESLSASLAAGASDTFTVRLDTNVSGTKAGDISFTSNDSDESPFNFRITGTVIPVGPEITVLGNGVSIADGDTTPSITDHTDFGSVVQGSPALSRTFTVRNDGASTLTLGVVTVPTGFTLTEGLSASLTPGASDTFTVQLETGIVGTKTGEISFVTNDSDENPFNFTITGTVTTPALPEVTVTVAPSAVAEDGATNLVYTFTRSVADSSALTVSFSVGGTATYNTDYTQTGAAGFSATSGTVVIGASQTTATVTVDPTADTTVEPDETVILTVAAGTGYTVGTPSASTGTIQNDDASGNLALGRPATASTSYPGLPASNATDGNTSSRWSSQFSDNEWIYVDLGSTYTINRIVLRWESAYGRGYKIQVSGNASAWSDVYSTTTGDGGVDDITLSSPASGRYVRMLGTQRATMYGYSLWEFEVYGGGATNHAPAVSSFSKSLMQDTPLPFAAADFTSAFTDPDAGDSLQKIQITSLPSHGVLTLSSTPVTVNQEIPVGQIGTLTYTPNSGYTGSDSFQWNGSDGNLYAASGAAVNLSINAAVANLALGKTAVASTSYSGLPASNATDGNVNSRWSSQFSDNEWIYVDLGSSFTISRVVLRWEAAYGRGYKIQVSSDASTWSDVYTTTTGDGGVDDISLSSPASGRYVRMLGTQRATAYGYSLYELEVYGAVAGPEVTVLGNGVSIVDGDTTPSPADGTDFGSVLQGGAAISRVFTVRNDGGSALTLGAATVPAGFTLTEGLSSSLAAGALDTFTVQLESATLGTKSGEISFTTNDSDENPFHFAITGTVSSSAVPEVTVAVAPAAVAEDGAANLVYTFTRSVADSSPLTVSFSVGGTATFGTDYTQSGAASFDATSGTVVIGASQTSAIVTIDPTADTTIEPDETVILTVTAGAGYTVGTPSVGTGTIQNDDGATNLALGRPATASTSYSGLPASNATDSNLSSRWSSQFSDSEWIYVDLGSVLTINRVVLRWEAAYGRGYKIQVSSDASTWSDVYSTTTGDGGVDDVTLSSPASGRYVRMLGTQRATAYGYSLYELEVYGSGGGAPEITVLGDGVSITDGDTTPSATDGTDFGSVAQGGAAISRTFTVRNDGTAALTLGAVAVPAGFTLMEGLSASLAPGTADTFTVRLDTAAAGTKTGDISFPTNDSDENPFNFRITGTVIGGNLALGKTAVASTSYSGLPASNVTDGNLSSRWSSQFSDSQWIYVDLGSVYTINRVVLRWETAYGRGYTIQVSNDASTWSDVYSTTTGDGGLDDITLSSSASGRYVRLLGTQRATAYGYSLWEFEVHG